SRGADRTQLVGRDHRRLGRLGGLLRRTLLRCPLLRGLALGGGLLRGFALGGRIALGLLLRRQLRGGLLLLLLLLRGALALQPRLFLGFLLGTELLLLDALGFGLLRRGDAGLEPGQGRMVLVGLLDQGVQALRLVEVAAVAA